MTLRTLHYGVKDHVLVIAGALFLVIANHFIGNAITPSHLPRDEWLPSGVPAFLLSREVAKCLGMAFGFCICVAVLRGRPTDWYPYTLVYFLPVTNFYGMLDGRSWLIILNVFLVIPVLEYACGSEPRNMSKEEADRLRKDPRFKWITLVWVPFQLFFLVFAIYATTKWTLSPVQWLGMAVSIGFLNGILGINISHELIHKHTKIERNAGKALLMMVCYGHWYTEHLLGHHKNVSTPHDPATAKLGQSFYAFLPQTYIGGFRSAWHLESARMKRKGLPVWSPHNNVLAMWFGSLLFAAAMYAMAGPGGVAFFLVQSLGASFLLELVDYIEHYGLVRKEIAAAAGDAGAQRLGDALGSGGKKYAPVAPVHSWNATSKVTQAILFRLMAHSDHHANAGRRYQILRSFEEAPQMPTGYAGMIAIAMIPPLWFRIMNPLVTKYRLDNRELYDDQYIREVHFSDDDEGNTDEPAAPGSKTD